MGIGMGAVVAPSASWSLSSSLSSSLSLSLSSSSKTVSSSVDVSSTEAKAWYSLRNRSGTFYPTGVKETLAAAIPEEEEEEEEEDGFDPFSPCSEEPDLILSRNEESLDPH